MARAKSLAVGALSTTSVHERMSATDRALILRCHGPQRQLGWPVLPHSTLRLKSTTYILSPTAALRQASVAESPVTLPPVYNKGSVIDANTPDKR